MREREVMFAAWSDIDFERGVFHVTEKKDDGFTIKDKEERSIPIPSLLLESLKQRYDERAHKRWIFPSDRGQPDGHMLRRLRTLAFRTGLNCGECRMKSGETCAKKASCKQFGLHKFRRIYATLNHENGTSIRTLMGWLGTQIWRLRFAIWRVLTPGQSGSECRLIRRTKCSPKRWGSLSRVDPHLTFCQPVCELDWVEANGMTNLEKGNFSALGPQLQRCYMYAKYVTYLSRIEQTIHAAQSLNQCFRTHLQLRSIKCTNK